MKHIVLSDFLVAPAKSLNIAIAEKAHIVSFDEPRFAFTVHSADDDIAVPIDDPKLRSVSLRKSSLLGSREDVRNDLANNDVIRLFKYGKLEIVMVRTAGKFFSYPANERINVGVANSDEAEVLPSFVIIDEEFFLVRNKEGLAAASKLFAAEWLVNSLDANGVEKVIDFVPEMNQIYPVLAHLYVDKNSFGEHHVCCDAVTLEQVKEAIKKF